MPMLSLTTEDITAQHSRQTTIPRKAGDTANIMTSTYPMSSSSSVDPIKHCEKCGRAKLATNNHGDICKHCHESYIQLTDGGDMYAS